jgi:hypothetical protein
MKAICLAIWLAVASAGHAWAWGQEGHSIVAEIAQRRLTPEAAAMVEQVLGRGHSLASIASWADDVRDLRTGKWQFVDIPIASMEYDPATQCEPGEDNSPGCIITELEQLRNDLRCAPDAEGKKDALRYAVHFVGDIHQPLHTVREEAGGNGIEVVVYMRGQTCPGRCRPEPILTNLHFVWDSTLINKTVWAWGSYVSRIEEGWLKSPEARGVDGGAPLQWALETHKVAQAVWNLTPDNKVLDDAYYRKVLPMLDKQLGLGGLRLARVLNNAYASKQCPVR